MCVLIPLLWGIKDYKSFKAKLELLRSNFGHILALVISAVIAGIPQLIYWKYSSGHWIYYSYNNAGEGFDFAQPYIKEVLFSFRKGWLIYTPVMVFAIAGFVSLFKKNKPVFYSILIYFAVNLYIVSSWTCWWYAGGSYSQRALLSSYVLLAIPMGYMIQQILVWKKPVRVFMLSVIALMLVLNLFQTWQWAHGIIDGTRMTRSYYFATFGKTNFTEADRKLLLIERPTDAIEILKNESDYNRRNVSTFDFENITEQGLMLSSDTVFEGENALRMDASHPFSPAFEMSFRDITAKDHAWIRASVMVFPVNEVKDNMASLVITFQHKGEPYHYRAISISDSSFHMKPGQWNAMRMDYLTPEVRSVDDTVKIYFWLQGNDPVLIDNLVIDVFD